jgi:hypothetical protein
MLPCSSGYRRIRCERRPIRDQEKHLIKELLELLSLLFKAACTAATGADVTSRQGRHVTISDEELGLGLELWPRRTV